tara:strand:- start:13 stop:189 length:177 start_codon:yes stop_codon:yes gene_type:complete
MEFNLYKNLPMIGSSFSLVFSGQTEGSVKIALESAVCAGQFGSFGIREITAEIISFAD